jgi:hypothetical protein
MAYICVISSSVHFGGAPYSRTLEVDIGAVTAGPLSGIRV